MNLRAFLVATLSSALDLGIAIPDDVLRHVTPDVLAANLPRPLWARLLAACIAAPRVDARLVVETIGVPNLCEHIPAPILWACIEELAQRALGGVVAAAPVAGAPISRPNAAASAPVSRPIPLAMPPPPLLAEPKVTALPAAVTVGPSIPAPAAGTGDGEVEAARGRAPASPRVLPSNIGLGRLAVSNARRPQAQAVPAPGPPPLADPPVDRSAGRRGLTESDFDLETYIGGKDDWKSSVLVEDEQLVDWSAADEMTSGDELGRKR